MKNVSIKKIPRLLLFYLKIINIQSNFINTKKKINRNTNFSKINYKNVSLLFFIY